MISTTKLCYIFFHFNNKIAKALYRYLSYALSTLRSVDVIAQARRAPRAPRATRCAVHVLQVTTSHYQPAQPAPARARGVTHAHAQARVRPRSRANASAPALRVSRVRSRTNVRSAGPGPSFSVVRLALGVAGPDVRHTCLHEEVAHVGTSAGSGLQCFPRCWASTRTVLVLQPAVDVVELRQNLLRARVEVRRRGVPRSVHARLRHLYVRSTQRLRLGLGIGLGSRPRPCGT